VAEYRGSARAVTDPKYHVIWVTKYRYRILRGDIAARAARSAEAELRGARGDNHPGRGLTGSPPHAAGGAAAVAPSKLVQFLKGRSSRLLQQEFPALRKRYWEQHLWARGYYCARVDAVDEQTIREYVENQQ